MRPARIALLVAALLTGAQSPDEVSRPIAEARVFAATGQWPTEPKIIDGRPVRAGDDPWQVALVLAGQESDPRILFCGGTLIGARLVLTAAHCVDRNTPAAALDAVVGAVNLARDGRRMKVSSIRLHPDYRSSGRAHDVALLELGADASTLGRPVPLADPGDSTSDAPGSLVRVTGWGATSVGGSAVRDLRAVDLRVMSDKQCNDPVAYDGLVGPTMMCAANGRTGKDSCQGDSGGPLTGVVRGVRVQLGVVSWGEGCGAADKFGVYARLTTLPWVHRCVADRKNCGS